MSRKYKQGIYTPLNPHKWVGREVVYRSSWELLFCKWADINPNVNKVASEEIVIPYFYDVDNKWHRYFPDYLIEFVDRNNITKTVMIEIKPYKEVIAPQKKGNKKESTFINEVLTYKKNIAKWESAKLWCKERNIDFIILTEKELGIK